MHIFMCDYNRYRYLFLFFYLDTQKCTLKSRIWQNNLLSDQVVIPIYINELSIEVYPSIIVTILLPLQYYQAYDNLTNFNTIWKKWGRGLELMGTAILLFMRITWWLISYISVEIWYHCDNTEMIINYIM